jgi:hypothetical protein
MAYLMGWTEMAQNEMMRSQHQPVLNVLDGDVDGGVNGF